MHNTQRSRAGREVLALTYQSTITTCRRETTYSSPTAHSRRNIQPLHSLLPCCVLCVLRQPCPVFGGRLVQYAQHRTSAHYTAVTAATNARHTARAGQDATPPPLLCAVRAEPAMPWTRSRAASTHTTQHKCTQASSHELAERCPHLHTPQHSPHAARKQHTAAQPPTATKKSSRCTPCCLAVCCMC